MTNWTEIYDRWQKPMHQLALRYLQNNLFAEDIVQDIFLRLLEKNISPQFMDHAEAYLRTAVYHRCMTLLRRNKMMVSIDEWAANTTEQMVHYRELRTLHFQAIQSLPRKQKEIYILKYIGGYKKEEMASLLGTSPKTIKKQLQTSNQKVRTALMELRA